MFLLFGLFDHPLPGSALSRAVAVFAVGAITETLQYFDVPLLGRTFDPLDYAMFGVGILAAAAFERAALSRLPSRSRQEDPPGIYSSRKLIVTR